MLPVKVKRKGYKTDVGAGQLPSSILILTFVAFCLAFYNLKTEAGIFWISNAFIAGSIIFMKLHDKTGWLSLCVCLAILPALEVAQVGAEGFFMSSARSVSFILLMAMAFERGFASLRFQPLKSLFNKWILLVFLIVLQATRGCFNVTEDSDFIIRQVVYFFQLICFIWIVVSLFPGSVLSIHQAIRAMCIGALTLGLLWLSQTIGAMTWIEARSSMARLEDVSVLTTNGTGAVLAFVLPMAVSLCLGKGKLHDRFIWLAVTLGMAVALLFTFSRGSWFGAVIGIATVLFMTEKFKRAAILIFLVVLSIIPFQELAKSRILYTYDYGTGRKAEWEICLEQYVENPILGEGWTRRDLLVANGIYNRVQPHGYWIDVGLKLGLFGVVILLLLVWPCINICLRLRKMANSSPPDSELRLLLPGLVGLMGFMSAFLLHGIGSGSLTYSICYLFWAVVLGLSASLFLVYKNA